MGNGNILSFEFASPQGELLNIERLNHRNRKILHNDIAPFSVTNKDTGDFREIHLRGCEIRKPGLWKDITNSGTNRTPKTVLLIDMGASDENEIIHGEKKLKNIVKECKNTEIHTAKNSTEAALFWNDRKHLGAIAKRTNAFKLNEDIVLPLTSIALFSDWTDDINIREERYIQLKALNRLEEYLKDSEDRADFSDKQNLILSLISGTEKRINNADKNDILKRTLFNEFQSEMKTVLVRKDFFRIYPLQDCTFS